VIRSALKMDFLAERARLQQIMQSCCGAIRTSSGLRYAKSEADALYDRLTGGYDPGKEYLELLNITTVAKAIVEAALKRSKSIGAHYIEEDETYVHQSEFPCSR
jgi:succinate dehydrogenase/fumarate reductase flavoprotein subunit